MKRTDVSQTSRHRFGMGDDGVGWVGRNGGMSRGYHNGSEGFLWTRQTQFDNYNPCTLDSLTGNVEIPVREDGDEETWFPPGHQGLDAVAGVEQRPTSERGEWTLNSHGHSTNVTLSAFQQFCQ